MIALTSTQQHRTPWEIAKEPIKSSGEQIYLLPYQLSKRNKLLYYNLFMVITKTPAGCLPAGNWELFGPRVEKNNYIVKLPKKNQNNRHYNLKVVCEVKESEKKIVDKRLTLASV